MRCPHSYLNCLYLQHRKADSPDKQDNTKAHSQTRVSSAGDTRWGKLLHVLHGSIFHTLSTRVSLRTSTYQNVNFPKCQLPKCQLRKILKFEMSSWVASLQWQPAFSWRHLSAPKNLGEAFTLFLFSLLCQPSKDPEEANLKWYGSSGMALSQELISSWERASGKYKKFGSQFPLVTAIFLVFSALQHVWQYTASSISSRSCITPLHVPHTVKWAWYWSKLPVCGAVWQVMK